MNFLSKRFRNPPPLPITTPNGNGKTVEKYKNYEFDRSHSNRKVEILTFEEFVMFCVGNKNLVGKQIFLPSLHFT